MAGTISEQDLLRSLQSRHEGLSDTVLRDVLDAAGRAWGVNPTDSVRPRAAEITKFLVEKRSGAYREAFAQGVPLSTWLEEEDPSDRYNDGLDAFERQCLQFGIRTRSVPSKGIYADPLEKLVEGGMPGNDHGVPTAEHILGRGQSGERLYLTNQPTSIVLFPEFINRQLRFTGQLLPALLNEMVAITTQIDSDTYRSFYLTLDTNQLSLRRVPEASPFATAELTGAEHMIMLHKYGREILGSYESYRRMAIDRFAFHLQRIGQQMLIDKSAQGLDVLINGDGNANTAATVHNQTDMQGGLTTDPLSIRGWLTFNLQFREPYRITHVIAQSANMINLLLLNYGSFNIPFAQFAGIQTGLGGGFRPGEPINTDMQTRLYARAFAPSSQLVAFDANLGLEMVTEAGADITEVDKIINRQLNVITISEVVGFAVLDQLATRVLQLGV